MKTNRVAIAGLVRTAVGRMGGVLAEIEAYQLQAHTFRETLARTSIQGETIDDVIVGNVCNSIGNVARVAALDAGIPTRVPAQTIDRQCASGMEALSIASAKILSGQGEVILAGGTESASRAPWLYEKTSKPYNYAPPKPYRVRFSTEKVGDPPMGETAEILADEFGILRGEMDHFAAESHHRAEAAHAAGHFAREIHPLLIPQRKGEPLCIDKDECIRPDTTAAVLSKLSPVFRKDGRVTAGNSSPMNDGAASAVVCSEAAAERLGVQPEAWLLGFATVGLDPHRMGMGPAIAIPRLLSRMNLSMDAIDLFEVNEAFAAQVLAVNSELKIPAEKLNVHGGAIALGHPLGCSGLRIVATLVNALRVRGLRRGVASLCVGGGQGMAVLVERA